MNDYRGKYKRKSGGANDPGFSRILRTEQHEERRKVNRAEYYSRYRDLSDSPEKRAAKIQQDPETRLRKWQLEKALKKKLEQRKKKPVFKVGVVHHHFYSPVGNEKTDGKPVPCHARGARKIKTQPSPPKRITRATQKRLEAKKNATTPVPVPTPGTHMARTKSPKKRISSAKKAFGTSFAPQNYAFRGPTGIERIPMFGKFLNRDSLMDKQDLADEVLTQLEKPWPEFKQNSHGRSSQEKQHNSLVRQMALDFSDVPMEKDTSSTKDFSKHGNDCKNIDSEPKLEVIKSDPDEDTESNNVETPLRSGSPAPALFSPYITTSRGKDSARQERRSKMGIGRTTPDEIPTKETIMQSLNISVEEEERTAQYFKFLLQREVDRLNEMCAKWEGIKSELDVTEDALYLINQAVGQTSLLVRKKFERFRGLVLDCESGKGEMLVQCRDLQGFWDMMYMEVKNCDSRFQKLEILRSKNWIEDEVVTAVKKPTGIKKKGGATKFTGNAKSSVRSWILAKKKKMAQAEEILEDGILVMSNSITSMSSMPGITDDIPTEKVSTRRSIKNSPRTFPLGGKRESLKATPNKTPASLLKKVQLSQANKSIHSPLAVMKISKMCKTPEIRLDDTISYVNSDQTPQKSILKKSTTDDSSSASDTTISKSTRKVDFNDDVIANEAEEIDENLENSIDLGRALARIDSYNSDDSSDEVPESPAMPLKNVTVRRIEKRLDFENESFNETENTEVAECSNDVVAATPNNSQLAIISVPKSPSSKHSSIPIVHVTEATPQKKSPIPIIRVTEVTPSTNSSKSRSARSKKRMSIVTDSPSQEENPDEDQSVTRVLRNRTVSMNTPNKSNRRSTKILDSSKLDLDLDSSTKENDNPGTVERKIISSKLNKTLQTEYTEDQLAKRRRSSRKSVRFNADECTACAESSKPVHPMTPHSRRSRKISLLADDSRQSVVPYTNGDLISFDSPSTIAIPPRVRRTSQYTKKNANQ